MEPTGRHPFLGPSENAMGNPGARGGYTMNPDPTTPQPGVGGPAANVAPPGMETTVRALKKEPGVDNPFALAWWLKGHGK